MPNINKTAQPQIDPSIIQQLLNTIYQPQSSSLPPYMAPPTLNSRPPPPPMAAPVRPQTPAAGPPVTPPNFMEVVGGKRIEYPAVRKKAAPIKKKSITGDEALFKMNAIVEGARLSPEAKMQLRARGSVKLAKMGVDHDTLMNWIATGSKMKLPQYQPSGYADTEGRQLRVAAKKKKIEIMLKPDKDGNLSNDQFQAVRQDLIDAGMKEEDITTGKGVAFLGLGKKGGTWRLTPEAKAKYTEMVMQEGLSEGRRRATPPSPTAPTGSFSEDEMMKMMNALQ